MKPDLIAVVLHRGNHRCTWCDCKLDTGRVSDRGVVCQLDLSGEDSSLVASCVACAGEYTRWWPFTMRYTIENAKRILGRHGATGSGPFVDYLNRLCKFDPNIPERAKRGLLTPFSAALARVEAQRNAPLDVVRKVRAA